MQVARLNSFSTENISNTLLPQDIKIALLRPYSRQKHTKIAYFQPLSHPKHPKTAKKHTILPQKPPFLYR